MQWNISISFYSKSVQFCGKLLLGETFTNKYLLAFHEKREYALSVLLRSRLKTRKVAFSRSSCLEKRTNHSRILFPCILGCHIKVTAARAWLTFSALTLRNTQRTRLTPLSFTQLDFCVGFLLRLCEELLTLFATSRLCSTWLCQNFVIATRTQKTLCKYLLRISCAWKVHLTAIANC